MEKPSRLLMQPALAVAAAASAFMRRRLSAKLDGGASLPPQLQAHIVHGCRARLPPMTLVDRKGYLTASSSHAGQTLVLIRFTTIFASSATAALIMNATLTFLADDPKYATEKLYELWRETGPGVPKSNCRFEERSSIPVLDMREYQDRLGYDSTGFCFFQHPSTVHLSGQDCSSRDNVKIGLYLNETIDLIKAKFGGDKVICFDWRVTLLCIGPNPQNPSLMFSLDSTARTRASIRSARTMPHSLPARMYCLQHTSSILVSLSLVSELRTAKTHSKTTDDSFEGGILRLKRILQPTELQDLDTDTWRVQFLKYAPFWRIIRML